MSALAKMVGQKWEWARLVSQGSKLPEHRQKDLLNGIMIAISMVRTITVDQGIELANLIDHNVVEETIDTQIMDAIDNKVTLSGSGTNMEKHLERRQTLSNPEAYQTLHTWSTYGKENPDACLMAIAVRLRRIGCANVDEKSFAAAAAVAWCRFGPTSRDFAL